jgi:hypothetical protein
MCILSRRMNSKARRDMGHKDIMYITQSQGYVYDTITYYIYIYIYVPMHEFRSRGLYIQCRRRMNSEAGRRDMGHTDMYMNHKERRRETGT